jgi:hypothetical protein
MPRTGPGADVMLMEKPVERLAKIAKHDHHFVR